MAQHRSSRQLLAPRDTVLLLVLCTIALGLHGTLEWLDHQHRLAGTRSFVPLLALRLLASSFVIGVVALAWRERTSLAATPRGPVGFALRGLACVVSAWARAHPSPYLWDESSVAASIEARRLAPRAPRLGTQTNSQGYYDDEFHPPRDDRDLVVAVLADSFGVGVVPREQGFPAVAERRLGELLTGREVSLHNFGIPGIGMPEYAWLLTHEVRAVEPQLVLLCVFVGNDFHSYTRNRGSYYSFHRFGVYQLAHRLLATRGEIAPGGTLDGEHLTAAETPVMPEPGSEVATFTPERFLEIERARMEITRAGDDGIEALYQRFFQALGSIQREAGAALRVVLIPDQFQVDDALWQELIRSEPDASARFGRDRPQRRVLAYCAERGIACLDLLPALRRAQAASPTYHLRDTHWNAHGNRVAGEVIARFLARGEIR